MKLIKPKKHALSQALIGLLGAFFTLVSVSAASADTAPRLMPLDQLKSVAQAAVKEAVKVPVHGRITIEASDPDSRLRLPYCPDVQASLPGNQSMDANITVKLFCENPHWQFYLSVNTTITVPMLVASRALPAGLVLDDSDLAQEWQSQNRLQGRIFTDKSVITGAKLKRGVQAGAPITADNLCLVCRGDKVTLRAGAGALSITAMGTALSDGTLGDTIRVRNLGSGRVVEARVDAQGQVNVSY
ncbi:MAG: flagellar basal body P-ring formation chaperone FlgA [Pseudomonadota bacterium]|uniref:flagellar basal body P-ring formation chaperone FlgA n=1 Tax=Gallaecimonas pentaromativorans TaxID=584787 RepID=UPI0018DC05F8|nr:flagellar basal body P-ring formation chaperone FlgA [Gallaecimonas pentaromativorans]MED5526725.1 flagellar basal body P-ring formation chaperone FlgA [Pseudomonadota bacterium]